MKRAWGPIFPSSASLRHWLPSIEQLPLCWQESFYLWRSELQWRFSKKVALWSILRRACSATWVGSLAITLNP